MVECLGVGVSRLSSVFFLILWRWWSIATPTASQSAIPSHPRHIPWDKAVPFITPSWAAIGIFVHLVTIWFELHKHWWAFVICQGTDKRCANLLVGKSCKCRDKFLAFGVRSDRGCKLFPWAPKIPEWYNCWAGHPRKLTIYIISAIQYFQNA